eukprot:6211000-Pleurochrysis_carterae.AAC.1
MYARAYEGARRLVRAQDCAYTGSHKHGLARQTRAHARAPAIKRARTCTQSRVYAEARAHERASVRKRASATQSNTRACPRAATLPRIAASE